MITLITGIVSGVSTTLLLMAINKSLGERGLRRDYGDSHHFLL
jgi:hypothetical protein